ncbi:MAG TPA: hypothetical protein VI564_01885 [Candidatus Nanoarchaeia archaeon]|nr:hypothetical protein [Candidatus Nanoarchaeia archaeon]
MPQNILISSLNETFRSIWKNKRIFILLFLLQTVLFSLLAFSSYYYQNKMLESAKEIADYIEKTQLDEISMTKNILEQKSILGDDPLLISRNYNSIKKNFVYYLLSLIGILGIFLPLLWLLSNKLLGKKLHVFFSKESLRPLIVVVFYLIIIFGLFYSLFSLSITDLASQASGLFLKFLIFILISAALLYFLPISICLSLKENLKEVVSKTFFLGIKKIHYILTAYIFCAIAFSLIGYFFVSFAESGPIIMSFLFVILISVFIAGRIYVISVIGKLEKEIKYA